VHGALIVAATVSNDLIVLDRPTGTPLWRISLAVQAVASPVIDDDRVFLATDRGVRAWSLLDGSALSGWLAPGEGASSDAAFGRDRIVYVSRSGELIVLDGSTGTMLSRQPGALPGFAPLVCHDRVFYVGRRGLMTIAPGDDGPALWLDTSWLGRPTAPMILAGSNLYAGMAGWGLVRLGEGR
jgi:outer membrane protein assembly factor BamB